MTEFVSKELNQIAKEHGFYGKINTRTTIDIRYTELIDWIFDIVEYKTVISGRYDNGIYIDWLIFWYNTLIPELLDLNTFEIKNKSALGILMEWLFDWFERNDVILNFQVIPDETYTKVYFYNNIIHRCNHVYLNEDDIYYNTKEEARHKGILKCFELLKS